jgi:hypothetical protein
MKWDLLRRAGARGARLASEENNVTVLPYDHSSTSGPVKINLGTLNISCNTMSPPIVTPASICAKNQACTTPWNY